MPKRCSVRDLDEGTFLANSHESVRVMGVILSIGQTTQDDDSNVNENHGDFPGIRPGWHENGFDVMSRLCLDDGTGTVSLWIPQTMIDSVSVRTGIRVDCVLKLRQKATLKRWYVNTLIVVNDPNAEALRWAELSNPPNPDNECRRYGFPRTKMNANEAHRLICAQSKLDGTGVDLKDLSHVMRITKTEAEEIVQDLQLRGLVYKNQKGNFVPL